MKIEKVVLTAADLQKAIAEYCQHTLSRVPASCEVRSFNASIFVIEGLDNDHDSYIHFSNKVADTRHAVG